MELGRDEKVLAERAVVALEKLAEDPAIEISGGPPECPHCGQINPQVVILESEGTGPLGDFVLQANCLHCRNNFWGAVVGWTMFKTVGEIQEAMSYDEEGAGDGTNS